MFSEETPPYEIKQDERVYRVVDGAGNILMECRDQSSAGHYRELLSRAYRAGYKAGFRDAKP